MMRSSARAAAVFILSLTCLISSQVLAGISITSYLSSQEPVFATTPASTADFEDDHSLSEASVVKESGTEEYKIGVMIKALSRAIASPDEPDSHKIITQYGTDSRYYVMIRGWLVQVLSGVRSQLDANRNDTTKEKLSEKVALLTQAIRRIDLE